MNPRLQGLGPQAVQHVMVAGQALDDGRVDEADRQLARALAAYPDHPEVLRMKAGILSLRGQHSEAIHTMQRALSHRPTDALYHNTLGSLLGTAGRYEDAIDALRQTCKLQPALALAWYNLGIMLTKCVRNEEATEALQRAVALEPGHVSARAMLADILRTRGHADEAAIEYRKLIAAQPTAGMAWWGLADLRTQRFTDEDIAQMRQALRSSSASNDDRNAIGFALAKGLDEAGQYEESLQALRDAHAITMQRQRWNAAGFSSSAANLRTALNAVGIAAPDHLGHEAIFIVSLPRSGSTLVEQILASHSQVEGAGELPDLPHVLTEETRRRGKPIQAWASDMQAADWERLGLRYLERTAHWRRDRPRFTDKLPNNWLYIGAIRAMLPAARIVICRRDPMETCFSCYRQRLDSNNGYNQTFTDLADFWRDFDASARHWSGRFPREVQEHHYEDLLEDPESSIRALLTFVGLSFEDTCLEFHRTRRDVRSPSATQVRQPLHRDTMHTTRYGSLLDPLRKALGLPAFVP